MQRASAKVCVVVQGMELRNFRRGRHLYSAGWPSRSSLYVVSVESNTRGGYESLVSPYDSIIAVETGWSIQAEGYRLVAVTHLNAYARSTKHRSAAATDTVVNRIQSVRH